MSFHSLSEMMTHHSDLRAQQHYAGKHDNMQHVCALYTQQGQRIEGGGHRNEQRRQSC